MKITATVTVSTVIVTMVTVAVTVTVTTRTTTTTIIIIVIIILCHLLIPILYYNIHIVHFLFCSAFTSYITVTVMLSSYRLQYKTLHSFSDLNNKKSQYLYILSINLTQQILEAQIRCINSLSIL